MKNRQKTQKLIEDAILLIENEITLDSGLPEHQLLEFKDVLCKMLSNIKNEKFISQKRQSKMGRIIVDSWPLDSDLGQAILKAEHSYIGK